MRAAIMAVTCALLSACGSQKSPIAIDNAWSPVTPPGASAAAVYMEISARETDVLLSATTPVAERTELHTTLSSDGMMQMRPLERVSLASGEIIRFEPGGPHFMLMNLRAAPREAFPLTLQFERAGAITINVTVRAHDEDHG